MLTTTPEALKALKVRVPEAVMLPMLDKLPTVVPSEIVKIGLLPLLTLKLLPLPIVVVKPPVTVAPVAV